MVANCMKLGMLKKLNLFQYIQYFVRVKVVLMEGDDIAEYANDSLNPSVTSGPCLWKKKKRRSTDNSVPVNELSTSLPGSSRSEPPTTEYYDPCPGLLPDVNAFYEGLKVLQPNASMLLNLYMVDHTTPVKEDCTIAPLLDYMNRVIKEHPTISTISQLLFNLFG